MQMKSNRLLFPVAAALVMNACGTKTHAENNSESVVLKKMVENTVKPTDTERVTVTSFYGDLGKRLSAVKINGVRTDVEINDTVRVIGVFEQPEHRPYKYLYATNKSGREYCIKYQVSPYTDGYNIVTYIERGDTVVIRDSKIVKNLTMDRLKSEFVKSR